MTRCVRVHASDEAHVERLSHSCKGMLLHESWVCHKVDCLAVTTLMSQT